jgi:hypothetical protein
MDCFQALSILGQLHVAIGTCSWTPVTPQVCNCADGYADHTCGLWRGTGSKIDMKKGRNYKTETCSVSTKDFDIFESFSPVKGLQQSACLHSCKVHFLWLKNCMSMCNSWNLTMKCMAMHIDGMSIDWYSWNIMKFTCYTHIRIGLWMKQAFRSVIYGGG